MKKINSENIQFQFEKITKKMIKSSLYCRFMIFDSSASAWQRRLELRSLLVNDLESSLENFPEDYKRKLLIPGSPPRIPGVSISISHCPILGGFIFSHDKNISLGLDVEKMDRVSLQLVQRVSDFDEVNEAPEVSFLWVAKEAAFKCIPSGEQKHFLRDLFIFQWEEMEEGVYNFNFFFEKEHIGGRGLVFVKNHLVFGCAFILKTICFSSDFQETTCFKLNFPLTKKLVQNK